MNFNEVLQVLKENDFQPKLLYIAGFFLGRTGFSLEDKLKLRSSSINLAWDDAKGIPHPEEEERTQSQGHAGVLSKIVELSANTALNQFSVSLTYTSFPFVKQREQIFAVRVVSFPLL